MFQESRNYWIPGARWSSGSGWEPRGPGPLGPGAGAGTPWARGLGAPGPKMWDTRGARNYLLSGRLPTVRQATYCQASYLLSGKLPTVRHAPKRSRRLWFPMVSYGFLWFSYGFLWFLLLRSPNPQGGVGGTLANPNPQGGGGPSSPQPGTYI